MIDLEVKLMEIMIKLMVQYPDGLDRIWTALTNVIEAGHELADALPDSKPHVIH